MNGQLLLVRKSCHLRSCTWENRLLAAVTYRIYDGDDDEKKSLYFTGVVTKLKLDEKSGKTVYECEIIRKA